jgi:hypothetical protein
MAALREAARRTARPNRMRILRGIAAHHLAMQPMRKQPMSHIHQMNEDRWCVEASDDARPYLLSSRV